MSARARRAAAEQVRALAEDGVSCIAVMRVQATYGRERDPLVVLLAGSGQISRRSGSTALGIDVRARVRLGAMPGEAGRWRAQIIAYQYALLDREGREYLAYHWHPEGVAHVAEPHLHLGPAAQVGATMLAAAHLPTGPVSLAAVVRLAVEAFAARPLRADWPSVLERAAAPLTPATA